MKKPLRLWFLLTMLSCPVLGQISGARTSSLVVRDFSAKGTVSTVLNKIVERYRIVIGVYGNVVDYHEPLADISIKTGTLKDVFNAIVIADPQLKWHESSDGAVHFVTWQRPLSLINVTVPSFNIDDKQLEDVENSISRIPTVHRWLLDHKCPTKTSTLTTGSFPFTQGRDVSLHVKRVPLYVIYDELAAQSHAYFWSVMQTGARSCAIYTKWQGSDLVREHSPGPPTPAPLTMP